MKHRLLFIMALLLTAASAWADEPTVYTSAVSVYSLEGGGEILADGFSLTGNDDDQICFIANRYNNGGSTGTDDAFFSLSNITYGENGAISVTTGSEPVTITPVDENGQVGNAWVVTGIGGSLDGDGTIIQIAGITYGSTPTDSPIDLTYDATAGGWTYTQPACDVELEMEYYDPATLASAPTAATSLEYSSEAQNLITAGTATGGTLYYGLGTADAAPTDASAWSETVPTGTTVGMYYVWYKVVGDATHGDIAPAGPLSVTIAKATPTISEAPTARAITYGQTLAESTLDAGSATYNSQPVTGSFAWANPTTAPSVSDSETTGYEVTFTPTDGNYNNATTTVKLTVNPVSAEGLTLTLSSESFTYNGSAQTPTVTVKHGETTLTQDIHYTVSYSNNTNAALSTAENAPTVTITGMGNYSGTASKTFTIAPKSLTDEMIQAIADQTYTGSALTPEITVTDGETTLVLNTDYENVVFTNNTNAAASTDASAPTVTITGKGNYSGSASKTFTITPKSLTNAMIQTIADQTYTGSALTPEITVTDGETTLVLNTDYENVVFTNNTNAAASTDASAPTVTITGKGNYSGSASKTFTIAPKSLTDEMIQAIADQTYTGSALTPEITVTDGETTLVLNTDYENVVFTNNTNAAASTDASAPTVTITGKGNYTGTATATFNIVSKAATGVTIEDIADQTYTGAAIVPAVVVKDGETTLTQDTHYTVSYSNNINAALSTAGESAPTVTVTGMGNYSGSITKTFTINKATATISYATTEVSKVFGDAAFTNTLDNTPAAGTDGTGLGTVTYAVMAEAKDADCTSDHVATIDASTGEVTITGTGSATITATATDGDNYTYGSTTTATYVLTVAKGTITASATGGSYSYSASGSHAITVSVTKPSSGYTIKYGTTAGNYELSINPSYSTIGSHTTYYKVSAPNYNDFTGQATVTINKASGSLSFASSSLTKTYGDDNFVNALYKTGDGAVTYTSTKPAVATVDASTGLVTIKGTGTTTIRATMSATDAYSGDNATFSLTVNAASLTGAMVTLSQTSYDYDGAAKEPTVSAVILNGKVLTSSDYDVSYADNTNAGTATVTVTGKGNYTGTASQTFTITSVTTTDGNITVVDGGSETVLTINDMGNQQGKTVTPDLQVTTLNYYRSLNASDESVYTVCLPYAPKTDASLKYYTLTGYEGTTLKFDEITGAPQAYTPYLVSASKTTDIGTENLNQPITMSQTVVNSFSAGNYVMKGSLSGFTHDQSVGKYILQSGNRWGLVGSDTHAYIPPFRAYIEATVSGARMLDSSFYDEATGIYSLRTVDRDGTERYYDLNGRRIDDPKKTGIYIRNGRKEVLK